MNRYLKIAGVLAAGSMLAACSEAAANDEPKAPEEAVVEVVGVDFGFEGLDDPIPAGTTLTFRNDSETEYHEIAVMKISDDETRSVEELLKLPPEEAMANMEFQGVASAMPGTVGELIDGDLTLDEPGRYVATCFVPTGADPEKAHEAFHNAEGGPPDLGDGLPHAMAGMVAEFTVE